SSDLLSAFVLSLLIASSFVRTPGGRRATVDLLVFNVPTLLTTGVAEHQPLLKELQAVFPDQKPIDRTGLCAWDDQRVVDWVKQTDRKRLVIAGLWTEICLNLAVQGALGDGYIVYIVPDASGGADAESHALAVQPMVQAAAPPPRPPAHPREPPPGR